MKFDKNKVIEKPDSLPDGEYYVGVHLDLLKDDVNYGRDLLCVFSNTVIFDDWSSSNINAFVYYYPVDHYTHIKCVKAGILQDAKPENNKKKEFTKSDLKNGMICTARDGSVCCHFGGYLLKGAKKVSVDLYNDDLTDVNNSQNDIVEVRHSTGDIAFERVEWKELTPREAFDLMDAFGVLKGECFRLGEWKPAALESIAPAHSLPFIVDEHDHVSKFRVETSDIKK